MVTTTTANDKKTVDSFQNPKLDRAICAKLHAGLVFIAGVCDGARRPDGVGFAGCDTRTGHFYANSDPSKWSFKMAIKAYYLCVKYSKQLGNGCMDMAQVRFPVSERAVAQNAPTTTATPWVLCANQSKHAPFQAFKKGTCFLLKLAGYEIFIYQSSSTGEYMGKVSVGRKSLFTGNVEDCKAFVLSEAYADQSDRYGEDWLTA